MIVILRTYHERSSMFIIFFFWKKGRWRKKLIIVLYRVPILIGGYFSSCIFYAPCTTCVVTESRVSLAQKRVKPFQTSSRGGENLFCTALTRSNRLWPGDNNIIFELRVLKNLTQKIWNLGCLLIRIMKTILHYANYS